MAAGRRAPDRAPVLIECYRAAFAARSGAVIGLPLFAGGRSMGGRIASMAAAEGMPAAGLVFLAYPLHPPGRPEKLRDAHLYGLAAADAVRAGHSRRLRAAAAAGGAAGRLGDRAQLVSVEGADHGFKRAGGPRDAAAIGASLAAPAAAFIDRVATAGG